MPRVKRDIIGFLQYFTWEKYEFQRLTFCLTSDIMSDRKGAGKISPRTGRPKADNPKTERVTVRLDDDTLKKLDENASHFQEDRSQAIRRGIVVVNKGIKNKA